VSPEWIGPGKTITVSNAPTMFGNLSMELTSANNDSALLRLRTTFGKRIPDKILLHTPWFMHLISATVDDQAISAKDGVLELPVTAKLVKLKWTRRNELPALSYASFVETYKAEYTRRYDDYLRTGVPFAQ